MERVVIVMAVFFIFVFYRIETREEERGERKIV